MKKNVFLRIYGEGQAVVLIPGFASRANSWGFQYRWLKKHFKVITVENNSLFGSQADHGDYYIDGIVSDLNENLESCGISKTAIVGSSMGGMIALEFANRYPEKVASVVLATLPVEYNPALIHLADKLNSTVGDDFSFNEFLPLFFSPDFVKQDRFKIFTDLFMQNGTGFSRNVLRDQLCVIREWLELEKWIKGCQCPCLFIYGADDQLVSSDEAIKRLKPVFDKSEFKVINGAGHVVHIEKHKEFNNIVYDFLKRQNW